MLFTLATTAQPATDLGFLLHKHPDLMHRRTVSFGEVLVCYPEATEARCEAALTVKVPFNRDGPKAGDPYVSDRPYAAGSYLPVAIHRMFGTAMSGRSKERQELADTAIPLDITVTPVAIHPGIDAKSLFEPLGWTVEATPLPLDPAFPDWVSLHQTIRLTGTHTVAAALRHVCVLLLVLDNDRHYFVGEDEIERLKALGDGWLDQHPLADTIRKRYLKFRDLIAKSEPESAEPAKASLHVERIATVAGIIWATGAKTAVDMGCGEGLLLEALLADAQLEKVTGVDPSLHVLDRARKRLANLFPNAGDRLVLQQGAATYPDERLARPDCVALVEVIEHIEPNRIAAVEENIFQIMMPRHVVVTTPNRDWNQKFEGDRLRHRDHRFEWSRADFLLWCQSICRNSIYQYSLFDIGEATEFGPPTQGCIFEKMS